MAEWLPITEAAQRLGVSERTVYRRLKSGALVGKKEAGKVFIQFDISSDNVRAESDKVSDDVSALARLAAEVERLRSENDFLREALAREQHNLMAAMVNQQKLLESKTGDDDSGRPWWKFW